MDFHWRCPNTGMSNPLLPYSCCQATASHKPGMDCTNVCFELETSQKLSLTLLHVLSLPRQGGGNLSLQVMRGYGEQASCLYRSQSSQSPAPQSWHLFPLQRAPHSDSVTPTSLRSPKGNAVELPGHSLCVAPKEVTSGSLRHTGNVHSYGG